MIVVYTMPLCGGCDQLKSFLRELEVEFEERPLMDAGSITDLRMAGCHDKIEDLMAPILQVGDRVMRYDDLFVGGELDRDENAAINILRLGLQSLPKARSPALQGGE